MGIDLHQCPNSDTLFVRYSRLLAGALVHLASDDVADGLEDLHEDNAQNNGHNHDGGVPALIAVANGDGT